MIKPEITAAARWWANQIRQGIPTHNNGDAFQSAMARIATSLVTDTPSREQIDTFESALIRGISEAPGFSGDDWRPEQPMWGGARRILATDYDPEPLLEEALKAARISDLLLPIKTIMWVDPGSVKVSRGYGAASETIYALSV
jgi:hypothetical protein